MYTRGQLVIIGNVGRKAIRLYEEEGLITSSKVDPCNGYHYYDDHQIERLQKIKNYRQLGLSISDIKSILCRGISEEEIFTEKRIELDQSIHEMQELRKKLENIDKNEYQQAPIAITEKDFPKCTCLFLKENVDLEKLGVSVGKLYEKAAKNHLTIAGAHFVKYEGIYSEDSTFRMLTCLPIIQTDICNEPMENIREESTARCIYTRFTGGFSKVGEAHIELKKYIEKRNLLCSGVMYEVYNQDMSVEIYYELVQKRNL